MQQSGLLVRCLLSIVQYWSWIEQMSGSCTSWKMTSISIMMNTDGSPRIGWAHECIMFRRVLCTSSGNEDDEYGDFQIFLPSLNCCISVFVKTKPISSVQVRMLNPNTLVSTIASGKFFFSRENCLDLGNLAKSSPELIKFRTLSLKKSWWK